MRCLYCDTFCPLPSNHTPVVIVPKSAGVYYDIIILELHLIVVGRYQARSSSFPFRQHGAYRHPHLLFPLHRPMRSRERRPITQCLPRSPHFYLPALYTSFLAFCSILSSSSTKNTVCVCSKTGPVPAMDGDVSVRCMQGPKLGNLTRLHMRIG